MTDLHILAWHCPLSGIRCTRYQSGKRKRSEELSLLSNSHELGKKRCCGGTGSRSRLFISREITRQHVHRLSIGGNCIQHLPLQSNLVSGLNSSCHIDNRCPFETARMMELEPGQCDLSFPLCCPWQHSFLF